MRNIIAVVVAALSTVFLNTLDGRHSPRLADGAAQDTLVRITAQQLRVTPPAYALLVTNLAELPIAGIVIGRRGLTFPIMGVAPNVPVRMDSPIGWEGRHVHVEERPYLTYYWRSIDDSKRILPQQSVAGFRIMLPEARGAAVQVTFDRIPFEVTFADGSSWSGVVGVDRIPK